MSQNQQVQFQVPSITPMVRNLVIINVVIWVLGVLIFQKHFMQSEYLFSWFGLTPEVVISRAWLWQFVSYMFLHSNSLFHVLFNMLMLWWLGAELERRWGSRFFLIYYLICGVGAGILYTLVVGAYSLITGDGAPLLSPVIGASGAVYGLFLAYGMIFGENIIYFLMIIPMKAKYFVMLLGGVELLTLLSTGFSSNVANLAHLGGVVVGFLFLYYWINFKGKRLRKTTSRHGRKLKLVVDNESSKKDPKYWN